MRINFEGCVFFLCFGIAAWFHEFTIAALFGIACGVNGGLGFSRKN